MTVFLGYNQYWPGEFMFVFLGGGGGGGRLCPGAPEGSTGSGSDFEASQKKGPRLKVRVQKSGIDTIKYHT